MPRMRRKADLPQKICAARGRRFASRKKWAKDWDGVKTCSIRCKGQLRRDRSRTTVGDGGDRARVYRWSNGTDGGPKSWYVGVDETLQAEIAHLRTEVYLRDAELPQQVLTVFTGFSV